MDKEYLFFYLESMIVCIIIFGILLIHDLVQGDRQERKFRFDNVLLSHMLYFAVDGVWACIIGGAIPKTPFLVLLLNYLLLFLLALVGCCWFFFTTVITNMPKRTTRRGKFMIYLPMFITCVITLIGFIVKPSLWMTDTYEMTTLYYFFFVLAPVVYIISAFLYSMYQASRKENILNRKLYMITGIYPLTIIPAGLFQLIFYGAPILCYSCTIMIILFNLLSMEDQISIDPLTKLNNRGQLMRYTSIETNIHRDDMKTYVMIGDVNNFKKINDTFGHAEGDYALVMIADALRRSAERSTIPPFLARYGGDEFIIIVHLSNDSNAEEEIDRMIEGIRSDLLRRCNEEKKPYNITIGFGYDQIGKSETFLDCMTRADRNLFTEKAQMKLSRDAQEAI